MDSSIPTMISTQEHQDLINRQELNQEGCFPCRFPGCSKSFKYNGKSRKKHELSHNLPVTSNTLNCTTPHASTLSLTDVDDLFNYNTALRAEGLLFLNFLDSVSEGDDERIINFVGLMVLTVLNMLLKVCTNYSF